MAGLFPTRAARHPGQHAGFDDVGVDPALRAAAAELPAGPGPGTAVVAETGREPWWPGRAGRGPGTPGRVAIP
jgi:hypothetical protein